MKKVVAVIPARNEEKYIGKTLEHLSNQTYPIERIIVVNDGSTDRTEDVVKQFPKTHVLTLPDRGYNAVGKAILAETFNKGFEEAKKLIPDYDFILVLGADTLLPSDYVESLIGEFEKNPKLVMASGVIEEEMKRIGATPEIRGTGRLIKRDFWESIGVMYPVKVGWESYPVFKAQSMGNEAKGYPNLKMTLQRPTGKKTDYFAYGEAMRALGYYWLLTLGRAISKKNLKVAFSMIKGYFKGKDRYEEELRKFVNKTQKRRMRKILFRF